MAQIHYIERDCCPSDHYWRASATSTWEKTDLYDGSDSTVFHVDGGDPTVSHNWKIPASAVVEVICRNVRLDKGYHKAGVRAVGSDTERILKLHECEGLGNTNVSMFVQADADSCIETYGSFVSATYGPRMSVAGYWEGARYVDLFETFTIDVDDTWTNVALSGYGISSGNIVEIACVNTDGGYTDAQAGSPNIVGARQVGSVLERKFELHEPEVATVFQVNNARGYMTLQVQTSGADANIEVYAQHNSTAQFIVLGYWSLAPGDYVECNIDIPPATANGTWQARNLSSSGIPTGTTLECLMVNEHNSTENWMGVQQNDGILTERIFDIHEAEPEGVEIARAHTLLGNDGNIYVYHEDYDEAHSFCAVGYWDNYVESPIPFPKDASCNLFIYGRNTHIHYIEFVGTPIASTLVDQWQVADISSEIPSAAIAEGCIAEIQIRNESPSYPYWGGVRSVGSNLEHKYQIHESHGSYNTVETVCVHVPVSTSGEIELYSDHLGYLEFRVLGCWVGAEYIETTGSFIAGATSGWTQHNLTTHNVPGGKIAEILISNSGQTLPHSGGIRAVGSYLDRLVDIASLIDNYGATWDGSTYMTMFVKTSGTDATIEVYAGNDDEIDFHVVGYWEQPPGDYTELTEVITPDATVSQWKDLDITTYNVPSGSISEIILANTDWTNGNILGVREYGSTLDRYTQWATTDDAGAAYHGLCGGRIQANVISGNIQTYHQRINDTSYFAAVGYWDNMYSIPVQTCSSFDLVVTGHEAYDVTKEASYPSGTTMYIEGVPWGSADMFISGPQQETTSGALWMHGPESNIASGTLFINAPHLVGTSGISGAYPGIDVEYGGPSIDLFISVSELCVASNDLFLKTIEFVSSDIDLFVKTFEPTMVRHYIEEFRAWTPTTKETWEEKDISAWLPDNENITAEIVIANSGNVNTDYNVGVRTAGSSLDRKQNLAWADIHDGYNSLTTHVQLSGGKLECYAPSGVDFFLLGYWVGTQYVELDGNFDGGDIGTWTNKNLDSFGVPSGAIVEFMVGAGWAGKHLGMRSVDNTDERMFKMQGGSHSTNRYNYWTSFIPTSGANATVQYYSESYNWDHHFYIAGYWEEPPGDYTEIFQRNEANPTNNGIWEVVDVSGVPSNSVTSFGLINHDLNNSRILGLRQYGIGLERKINLRDTSNVTYDMVQCWHTNLNSDVETCSEDATGIYDDFTLLGYWSNLIADPQYASGNRGLFTHGHIVYDILDEAEYPSGVTLFTHGHEPINSSDSYPSGVPFCIYGVQLANTDLFINGLNTQQASGALFVHGIHGYATNAADCPAYPSGVSLYAKGSGIIPHSGQRSLYTFGHNFGEASGDLFVGGVYTGVSSGDLFLKTPEPETASLDMIIYNQIDPSPGLIREANAIFYLRYYHDGLGGAGDIQEFVNDQVWYIPTTLFQHSYFIGVPGKTIDNVDYSQLMEPFVPTFGDGTYPQFNDLGGSNYREAMDTDYRTPGGGWQSTKLGYYESTKYKQNICEAIEYYQYAGSGSFTTVFWMSGAHTSGNVAEVGWFQKNDPDYLDVAFAKHTIGIKIEGTSGITVITNVRDLPYDQISGGGLWWGGTTHYGTPTGASYTWRSPTAYYTWTEEWPTVYINHDPIAFVVLHADFIASGIDGNHPNHTKVWLSLDGQPWTYIGSGLTGPPASSLYSYDDPVNRYPENCVGVRQQGVNVDGGIIPAEIGGIKQGSIILAENVLWTDADKFSNDELVALHSIVDQYNRPLNEYKPTIVSPSTYIQRTIGMFAYDPTIPNIGYNPGEICSGLRVTIEVGLGAYGQDASTYLLEETPPSGFYVDNIQPVTSTTYHSQGSRPNGAEQTFHDPQSGVMQPYNNDLNLNSYGTSIRWVNHDNHPEINQRRSPTPTGIYSYDLFPIYDKSTPRIDEFVFAGSGIFFGGSTDSGIFVVETTGDTTGTTSGLTGCLISDGCSLCIQGPLQRNETVNLYLRTQEIFTSAYIGTSNRTPELTDFIFAADGNAAIESMAGIEYGPSLYARGPLQYEDTCALVIFGPAANDIDFFIQGHAYIDTSGDYPSGMLLRIGDGHEALAASGDLFIDGPTPWSDDFYMHTRAGAFEPPIDLFNLGHAPHSDCMSGYIKGPEFICSSGSFSYPHDINDFTYPYGASSPTLYMHGKMDASGICPLYIGPLRIRTNWTFYLKTDDNDENIMMNLFINGFLPASGSSGINQAFNNVKLYLEAADADYPYTAGGTEEWTLFVKAQSGNLTRDEVWTLFLKSDFTVPATCNLYTRGHAPGQPPNGIEITNYIGLICSVNPDDPTRIGFIPHDSHDDPWNMFLKCEPGHFGIATLYMSGATPTLFAASGNLFVGGLFEQETDTLPFYVMGVSGMFNNGPSGLHLFLDAGIFVYNTRANLYAHGY